MQRRGYLTITELKQAGGIVLLRCPPAITAP